MTAHEKFLARQEKRSTALDCPMWTSSRWPPEATGRDRGFVAHVADGKECDRHYSVDITTISTELGYAPRAPFEHGLADTMAWHKEKWNWRAPLKERASLT